MSNDLEQLVLSISADTRQIQRALKKLEGDTGASTRKIEANFDRLSKRINGSLSRIGSYAKTSLAALAGAFTIREAQRFIDSATRVENSLKVTGLRGEELTGVFDKLFDTAQRNAAPLEGMATLFSRVTAAQKQLGVSTDQILGLTETVAQAIRISGGTAEEASGALLQLSQALGGGKVQAEEYGSMIDGLRPLLQAAANGIQEAGGDVAKLTALVKDGKISSQAFFLGIEAGAWSLKEQLADVGTTSDQAMTIVSNALIKAAGKFDDATGASKHFANNLIAIADVIAEFDIQPYLDKITSIESAMTAFGEHPFWAKLNQLMGVEPGKYMVVEGQGIVKQDELTPDGIRQFAERTGIGPTANTTPKNGRVKKGQRPIPASKYAPPSTKNGKKAAGSKTPKADDFEREVKSIRERTAALQAETAAQAQVNPLVDDYGYTVTRASEAQALLTAAKEAGTAAGKELSSVQQLLTGDFTSLSPKAREQAQTMLMVAEGYASAQAEADRLAEAQDKIRQKAEEAAEFQKDLARSVVDGFIEGKDAAEVFADALDKIGSKLLDLAFDAAFDTKSGGGNFLGQLFGGLLGGGGGGFKANTTFASVLGVPGYAGGTNFHPGGAAIVGEKGPELLNLPRGAKVTPNHMIPRAPALADGGRSSPTLNFNHSPTYDMRGASLEAVSRLEMQRARDNADFEARVKKIVRERPNGRW